MGPRDKVSHDYPMVENKHSAPEVYGEIHSGQYHLGPVDFAETVWHNACAPGGGYRNDLRANAGLGGEYLAGVSHSYAEGGGVCDRCIFRQ